MLVYFFSDRNYVRSGFYAHYTVSPCPHNCSGHGQCLSVTRQCRCFAGYVGRACEHALCAAACDRHGGRCSDRDFTCECPAGRRGFDCGLAVDEFDVGMVGVWSEVTAPGSETYAPRAGHAGVVIDNCLYVFGGTTLNVLLSDLVKFCVDDPMSSWHSVAKLSPWPAARHGHTMCLVGHEIFLYGGVLDSRGAGSNELWVFDVRLSQWRLLDVAADGVRPPALSGHTMTAVDDHYLYVVGGRTSGGEFISDVHVVTLQSGVARWRRHGSRGGREAHHRLVGHTTVFHRDSRSLMVFGGFSPENARFPRRSSQLMSYHVDTGRWLSLSYDTAVPSVPRQRAYHAAVIVGNYMLIHGGQVHAHHEDETCYDTQIYVYHLSCHVWVDFFSLTDTFTSMSTCLSVCLSVCQLQFRSQCPLKFRIPLGRRRWSSAAAGYSVNRGMHAEWARVRTILASSI